MSLAVVLLKFQGSNLGVLNDISRDPNPLKVVVYHSRVAAWWLRTALSTPPHPQVLCSLHHCLPHISVPPGILGPRRTVCGKGWDSAP